MDTNDYLGSWADENVSFSVQIVRTAVVGQNYWTPMIFVENSRYVDTTAAVWEDAPGVAGCKVLVVTASNYANYTTGLLQSWLYDLFANGFTGNCILVACAENIDDTVTYTPVDSPDPAANPSAEGWYEESGGEYVLSEDTVVDSGKTYYTREVTPADPTAFIAGMTRAYQTLKPYGYFKTVLAGADILNPQVALSLAQLCAADKGLLSSAPLYPAISLSPVSDPLYSVLNADARGDAFLSYHSDTTHNGALYSLGLALAVYNASGTPVGNNFDAVASGNITPSGEGGTNLGDTAAALITAKIQYFKTVGDNTLNCAAFGAQTIKGDTFAATWILSYITYMTKVNVAQLITQRNFLKNESNYGRIVTVMASRIKQFANARLTNISITAPSFANLPEAAGDVIVIPNAWSATYVDNIRSVTITGTLYIGA